jgi:hypothetical protein
MTFNRVDILIVLAAVALAYFIHPLFLLLILLCFVS